MLRFMLIGLFRNALASLLGRLGNLDTLTLLSRPLYNQILLSFNLAKGPSSLFPLAYHLLFFRFENLHQSFLALVLLVMLIIPLLNPLSHKHHILFHFGFML